MAAFHSRVLARWGWPLALLGVLALVAAVYAPTVDDYFGGDDFMVLGPVRALGPWELIWKSFLFQDEIPYWRPLISPVYAFEVHVFGLNPWPYHVVVIALHLVNVALLVAIARTLTGRRWVALAAGIVFGINPAKTTTVPMISSTVELFGMIWYLAAVLCCLRFVRGGGRRWYWLGFGAFLLGLLSKESIASAAGVATALFFFLGLVPAWRAGGRGRALRSFLLRALPFLLVVAPYTAITFSTNREDPTGIARAMYFAGPHVGRNLWWLLARLAAPIGTGRGPDVPAVGHAGAALLCVAALWVLLRGRNETRFLVAWTAIALTPLALWRPELLVGRFTYMACAPFGILLAIAGAALCSAVARGLPRAVPRPVPALALTLAVAALFGSMTMEQDLARTREGEAYRLLVATLASEHPALPAGSEVVLEDGIWRGPFHAVFLNSVADTLYGPGCVRIRNAEGPALRRTPRRPGVIHLLYRDGALLPDDVEDGPVISGR